jgi:histidinol-phosphatase (PHP family)
MNRPRHTFTANWHSHTFRCKHAAGDVIDYCAEAMRAGITTLGISDHSPTLDGRWPGVRMDYALMPDYINAIRYAAVAYPGLRLYAGLECEWVPSFGHDWFEGDLRGRFGLDFIAFAPHSFTMEEGSEHWYNSFLRSPAIDQKAWVRGYARYVVEAIGTGLFDYVAHPDLIGCFCTAWTPDCAAAARDIAQAARDASLPLELNTSGFRKPWVTDDDGATRPQYPWAPFWEVVAAEGATVMVNTDAHAPEFLAASLTEAFALADAVGLEIRSPVSPADMRR